MSDFGDLLKEALTGAETVPHERNQQALQAAVEAFDRRNRTVRWMATFSVGFMSLVAAWSAWSFFQTPDDALKPLIGYAVLFLFAMTAVGTCKMWFAMMLDHLAVMKELKRMQLAKPAGSQRTSTID